MVQTSEARFIILSMILTVQERFDLNSEEGMTGFAVHCVKRQATATERIARSDAVPGQRIAYSKGSWQ